MCPFEMFQKMKEDCKNDLPYNFRFGLQGCYEVFRAVDHKLPMLSKNIASNNIKFLSLLVYSNYDNVLDEVINSLRGKDPDSGTIVEDISFLIYKNINTDLFKHWFVVVGKKTIILAKSLPMAIDFIVKYG